MKINIHFLAILIIYLLPINGTLAQNSNYKSLEPEPEDRRIRRRKRPCGRDANSGEQTRTFFDWKYSYVNVNHNYNLICGGNGGNGGGVNHQPLFGNRPIGGQHVGLLGLLGQHGGSGGSPGYPPGGGSTEDTYKQWGGRGPLGFGFLDLFTSNPSSGENKPERPDLVETPELVEKPVVEDYDDSVPEGYQNLKPGQYLTASNPYFGTYMQDISNFNPRKVIRQVNREVNSLFRPLYKYFKR